MLKQILCPVSTALWIILINTIRQLTNITQTETIQTNLISYIHENTQVDANQTERAEQRSELLENSACAAVSCVETNENGTGFSTEAITSQQVQRTVHTKSQLTTVNGTGEYCVLSQNNVGRKMRNNNSNVNNNCDGWEIVSHKKKHHLNRYIGKSGKATDSECNFKAADRKTPIFITNIHSDTTEEDIIKYISNKTDEIVSLEKINMKRDKGHKAYKFLVSESKLSLYLDEYIWPQGIVFRRFVNYRPRNASRFLSKDGVDKNYTDG